MDSLKVKVKISAVDTLFSTTTLYFNTVIISNTGYFQYLGSVVFDPLNPSKTTYKGYRFIYNGYTALSNTTTHFDFDFYYIGNLHMTTLFKSFYRKSCGTCAGCPTRLLVSDMLKILSLRYFSYITITNFPGYSGSGAAYPTLGAYQQGVIATMLNWFLNKTQPTVADYINILNPNQIGNSSVPSNFCIDGNPPPETCECKADFLSILNGFKIKLGLINSTPGNYFDFLNKRLRKKMEFECDCKEYCYFLLDKPIPGAPSGGFILYAIPYANAFSKTYIVYAESHVSGPGPLSGIAGSSNYLGAVYTGTNAFSFFPRDSSMVFNTGTSSFNYNFGFGPYNDSIFSTECSFSCIDCIASFAPIPGKKYLVSGWVKEKNAPQSKTSYTFPSVKILFPSIAGSTPSFLPTGQIIDGWQRIEGEFLIPASTTDMSIKLECATGDCFFDDIRVFPFDGSMKSYVYDPVNMRLMAELDERNYATLYEYDDEGKLIRVKKETEKGKMTIQENRNNTKK